MIIENHIIIQFEKYDEKPINKNNFGENEIYRDEKLYIPNKLFTNQ